MEKKITQAVIVVNAPLNTKSAASFLESRMIVAADGGANYLLEHGIEPDIIIGDLDSIDQTIYQTDKFFKVPEQDKTDLEKAIIYCQNRQINDIVIANGLYERADHSIYNLRLLKKYHSPRTRLRILNDYEIIEYFENQEITLNGEIGDRVAVISFPEAVVNSKGLEYDMQDYLISFGGNESVSNSLKNKQALINIDGCTIVIQELKF